MTPDKLATVKASIEASEGRIPWLYRDSGSNGWPTCGGWPRGFRLPSVHGASVQAVDHSGGMGGADG